MKWSGIGFKEAWEEREKDIATLVNSIQTGEPLPEKEGLWQRVRTYIPKSIRQATITGLLLTSMAATTLASCIVPPSPTPYVPSPTKPAPTATYTVKPEESPIPTLTTEPSPTPLECELAVYTVQPGDTATNICEQACIELDACLEKVAEQVESKDANILEVDEEIELYFPVGMFPTPTPGTPTPTGNVTPRPSPSPTETMTPSPSPTIVTPSPTPIPVYTLSGIVFFDYNGSGLQDAEEPGIQGAPVCIDSLESVLCSISEADGSYLIGDIPGGSHKVYVKSPTDEPATAFRYINKFLGWVDIPAYEMNGVQVPAQHLADTEIQPIDQPLRVTLNGDQNLEIALMQGFLTLPFKQEDFKLITKILGFDHDGRVGYVKDYKGNTTFCSFPPSCNSGVSDSHPSWDYGCPIRTFLIATVSGQFESWRSDNDSLNAWVKPGFFIGGGHEVASVYGHLNKVLVNEGAKVYRGQIIALSGMSGTQWPHLDLALLFGQQNPPEPDDYIPVQYHKDPFGVSPNVEVYFGIERYSSWTVFNSPKFPL